ncbi:MAG: electron transfer flavoprotein subunit alpha/FixB family protein [Rhodospirillaceae bacterium]|nr:electron transfer flavoprotein subunit alpha/FixB family protein [Rhodospirillaceae bacterium]
MSGILIIAEHIQGALRDITGEMIGAAASIKEAYGGPVNVAIISDNPESLSEDTNLAGVDEVFTVKVSGPDFDAAVYEEVACQIGAETKPGLILFGHTVNGMACSSAVAARLGAGYASDVFELGVEASEIVATRSAYGNKVNLEMVFPGKGIVVLGLRGATFLIPEEKGSAAITSKDIDVSAVTGTMTHVEYQEAPPSDIDISKADFIMSIGRGIQDKENLPRFEELAKRLGATFGCSRPIVDSGWLPKPHQVGQSGKVASNCKLYIALGISGAVQHQFGMKHVDTIIAVNTDPEAPIFNVATYGVTMDIFELADALERQFN